MEQSTDETQPDASQSKTLTERTRSSDETSRCWCCPSDIGKASNELSVIPDTFVPHKGEYEASQDKNTDLGGTNIEQRVKCLEDTHSEMNVQLKDVMKRVLLLERKHSQEAVQGIDCCASRLQEATDNSHRFAEKEISRMVSLEKFHQKEEECEKLKEEKRVLKQRLDHILAKAVDSHKFSENLNDPCRLSAVLEMYDRLRTHEWEKAKCAARLSGFSMTYKDGGIIIKAVFSTCEEELSQKMHQISELLEILFWKETTSQQLPPGIIKDIKNHIQHLYFNYEEQIYCTRSMNPPIKAEWPRRIPPSWIEHVDNKEMDCSMPVNFLWPVLTCGEQVIRKGVIYY